MTILSLFIYFFDEKISHPQKHVTSKNQLKNKNKLTLNNKGNNFSGVHKLLSVTCFCAYEIFSSKKKISRLEIVLIISIYNTTLELAVSIALKFYISVVKELELRVRKFLGLILAFVAVTGKKLLNRVTTFYL